MYFITAIYFQRLQKDAHRSVRCFGFFQEKERAIKAAQQNEGSMGECLYDYLVIEKIDEGIHAQSEEIQWYEWNDRKNGWKECEKPEILRGLVNFAIA